MEKEMHLGGDYKIIPATSLADGLSVQVLPDIYCKTIQIVNIAFISDSQNTKEFVLVDAGMPGSAKEIIAAVQETFGEGARPQAIFLTHGHFDHVGAILDLITHWQVPVYAHNEELPFLQGNKSYPEPDPSVEGGMIAKLSGMFPNEPVDLGNHVQQLPLDGTVPFLKEWKWHHTPGHTPGHVSFFRERDRALIAGDAFVTVKQEYLYKVLIQEQEISGPPRYFTPDWLQAEASVQKINQLHPAVAVTGHGLPMAGDQLKEGLISLVENFQEIAVPDKGKYADAYNQKM
ncbi:MBL fold metallo-hydrolase [Thalassobacillus sp. C254]|uniref:MBL fold metallo-hydrolase n=1 Tax=Thalassobacillus sp. C254 TaxID=1225341 RepID=UPI0006D1B0CF|nr:MBL fold metallo-hydrolase [Thalassobacillus sp. C254]